MRTFITVCAAVYCLCLGYVSLAGEITQENVHGLNQQSVNVSNVVLSVVITNRYIAGDVMPVCVSLKNQSNTDIYFFRGFSACYDSLDINVSNGEGKKIGLTEYGSHTINNMENRLRGGMIKLAPGEKVSMDMNLSRLIDLTEAGEYFLSIGTVVSRTNNWTNLNISLVVDKFKFAVSSPPNQDKYDIEKHLKGYGKGL